MFWGAHFMNLLPFKEGKNALVPQSVTGRFLQTSPGTAD